MPNLTPTEPTDIQSLDAPDGNEDRYEEPEPCGDSGCHCYCARQHGPCGCDCPRGMDEDGSWVLTDDE